MVNGGTVFDNSYRHISLHTVFNQLLLDGGGLVQTHIKHQRLFFCRQVFPVQLTAGFQVSGDQTHALGVVAVGQRNTRVGRTAGSGGNTGYNGEGNTCMAQGFQLFTTAAKDKRITAFQTHHAFTLLSFAQQDLVNFFLRYAVVASTFTHEHAVGVAANQIHNVVGDQAVVNHHVCLLDLL